MRMPSQKRSKALSAHTVGLLASGESERADFKRQPEGISSDDLVAFANSRRGGSILAGVREDKGESGEQIGIVVGCDVSDASVLQIVNKALGCLPPVAIEVRIENLGQLPILRIDVPSSSTKPHCTPKGVYCVRDGSRNRALHPAELLQVFLENESRSFAERFEAAADRISTELTALEKTLDGSIERMSDQLGWTDAQLDETESKLTSIEELVEELSGEATDTNLRRAIFRQDNRQDPVKARERQSYLLRIIKQVTKDKDLLDHVVRGGGLKGDPGGKIAEELGPEEISEVLEEAAERIRQSVDDAKYSVAVKSPKDFSSDEIDQVVDLIAAGGEVADGVLSHVRRALWLGTVAYEGKTVGTAAIKTPLLSYRQKAFAKAKSDMVPEEFEHELGWIFLQPDHRKKGQMTRLLKQLLPLLEGKPMFATTRVSNEIMQEVLIQWKFEGQGEPYPSKQRPGEMLRLFVLRPS